MEWDGWSRVGWVLQGEMSGEGGLNGARWVGGVGRAG